MGGFWKVIITVFVLYVIIVDGNSARRRRRQIPPHPQGNSLNQQGPPNPSILNAPGQHSPQQGGGPNDFPQGKQGSRQYYSPYQGQYGYGSVQGLNYPYAGAGVGAYQYGYGQYGQYGGQGIGQYGGYYNQYPGSGYSGYNSGSYYNRPGSSNYYPSSGYGGYGGYFWNSGHKQHMNMFTVLFSTLLTLVICWITV